MLIGATSGIGALTAPAAAVAPPTQQVGLHNDQATTHDDCPGEPGLYWHFVITPGGGNFQFVEIVLNLGSAVFSFAGSEIIPNNTQVDNVFVEVPSGYELADLVKDGSYAMIAPSEPAARFVLSHLCVVGSTVTNPPTTTTATPTTAAPTTAAPTTAAPTTATPTTATPTTATPTTATPTTATSTTEVPSPSTTAVASAGPTTTAVASAGPTTTAVASAGPSTTAVASAGPATTTGTAAGGGTTTSPVTRALPATGSSTASTMLWVGLVLAVLGLGLVATSRRRAAGAAGAWPAPRQYPPQWPPPDSAV